MDEPTAHQWHDGGPNRIADNKDNSHDDSVSHLETIVLVVVIFFHDCSGAARPGGTAAVGRSQKRVRIRSNACLLQVDRKAGFAVVGGDGLGGIGRVQRRAHLPGRDPARGAAEIQVRASSTQDIGDHAAVDDARAFQKRDIGASRVPGHDVTLAFSCAEGDVVVTVLVNDKHAGSLHGGPSAQGDPLIRCGSSKLEIEVARPGTEGGLRGSPLEASISFVWAKRRQSGLCRGGN